MMRAAADVGVLPTAPGRQVTIGFLFLWSALTSLAIDFQVPDDIRTLAVGWNLISLTREPLDGSPARVLEGLGVIETAGYSSQSSTYGTPAWLSATEGYWVYVGSGSRGQAMIDLSAATFLPDYDRDGTCDARERILGHSDTVYTITLTPQTWNCLSLGHVPSAALTIADAFGLGTVAGDSGWRWDAVSRRYVADSSLSEEALWVFCTSTEPVVAVLNLDPHAYMLVRNLDLSVPIVEFLSDLPGDFPATKYRSTAILLRRIQPGSFTMGSPADETGRDEDETQVNVQLTQPYYVSVYEVTGSQYAYIMGNRGTGRSVDTLPVQPTGSWGEVRGGTWPGDPMGSGQPDEDSLIGVLRSRTAESFAVDAPDVVFDLPTEAQWEYACRAGAPRAYNDYASGLGLGSECSTDEEAIDGNLEPLAWYWGNAGSLFHEVGSLRPNAWGLFDMHGNVAELCLDYYGDYPDEDQVDPYGPATGTFIPGVSAELRVVRGGHIRSIPANCRSAARDSVLLATGRTVNIAPGFRICATVQSEARSMAVPLSSSDTSAQADAGIGSSHCGARDLRQPGLEASSLCGETPVSACAPSDGESPGRRIPGPVDIGAGSLTQDALANSVVDAVRTLVLALEF